MTIAEKGEPRADRSLGGQEHGKMGFTHLLGVTPLEPRGDHPLERCWQSAHRKPVFFHI